MATINSGALPGFHKVSFFVMSFLFIVTRFSDAQEQTIELKQTVVKSAISSSVKYSKMDTMETIFQVDLPNKLNRVVTQKMNLPLDMRMLDWSLTEKISLETELNTAVSVFWQGDLNGRWKMTNDPLGYYRNTGLIFDIIEQSLQMKNSFEVMQVFEKYWQFAKNRIRIFRYDYASMKKKTLSSWMIAVRQDSEKGTSYHFTLLSPGMTKPLELMVNYKDLFIESENTNAPMDSFGTEFGLWHEQYTIDKSTYTDILFTVCAETNDNGLLIVLRYMGDEYLGHGVFNYLETSAK